MASIARPPRPASVLFLAVCQLIVGGIGIVYETFKVGGSLLLLASPTVAKAAANANPAVEISLHGVPYFLQAQIAASLVGLVLSIVLIVDGIGLLRMRRWAYNLGVLYGWISIIYQVAWMAFLILVALPVMLAGIENMPVAAGTPDPQSVRDRMKIAEYVDVGSTALGLLYPIFVLIMLAVVRNAFRRPKTVAEAAADYVPGAAAGAEAAEEPPPGYGVEPEDRIGPTPR
jgi:hypothetical protein